MTAYGPLQEQNDCAFASWLVREAVSTGRLALRKSHQRECEAAVGYLILYVERDYVGVTHAITMKRRHHCPVRWHGLLPAKVTFNGDGSR